MLEVAHVPIFPQCTAYYCHPVIKPRICTVLTSVQMTHSHTFSSDAVSLPCELVVKCFQCQPSLISHEQHSARKKQSFLLESQEANQLISSTKSESISPLYFGWFRFRWAHGTLQLIMCTLLFWFYTNSSATNVSHSTNSFLIWDAASVLCSMCIYYSQVVPDLSRSVASCVPPQ